jgi:hypothetical protein
MSYNNRIKVAELEFDDIKQNLKTFLTAQEEFSDYDYEGSALSVLIDLLAYNTHYNAYLANMVGNELFLDSAVKRESAVSIAKHLGYTPLSYRSAKAKVTFNVPTPTGSPASLTLPKFSIFTTTIDGARYNFCNLDAITIKPVSGVYTFTDVPLVEGEPLTYTYRVDLSGPDEKYIIPNNNNAFKTKIPDYPKLQQTE